MDAASDLRTALDRVLRAMFPGVFGARTTVRARVVKVRESAGKMSDLDPRYSVDVQVLDRDGEPDPAWPIIPDVELPMLWAGPGRGVFCVPDVGAVVRVGFYHGDQNQPYIEAVTGMGYQSPSHPVGRFLIVSGETQVEITPTGDVIIRGANIQITGQHVTVSGPTSVNGDARVQGSVAVDGPVSSGVSLTAPAVAAGSLSVGGVSVPGSSRSGTIVIPPMQTVQIEVKNGMVMNWS